MITERSIKLLSSVMLISANRIKVLRLWLTYFEDWPIRILTFAWWMLKTRNTMVSWQVACAAGGIVWWKFWRRSRDPKKKGVGTRRFRSWRLRRQLSLDWYSGSAAKSPSPSTQYRQLCRLPGRRFLPSLRAALAFLSRPKLPFPSLSNACHAG